jgi:hypothetical protein
VDVRSPLVQEEHLVGDAFDALDAVLHDEGGDAEGVGDLADEVVDRA